MDVIPHHTTYGCGWCESAVWLCDRDNVRSATVSLESAVLYDKQLLWESSADDDSCLEFASLQTALAYVSFMPY